MSKILIGMPATVPMPYMQKVDTKGSGQWLETFATNATKERPWEIVTMAPAYQTWPMREEHCPWKDIPIVYQAPDGYKPSGKKNNRWEPASPEEIDIQLPIHGFTRSPGWRLFSNASAQDFRAMFETTRYLVDIIPYLLGRTHWDVLYPQHCSLNLIAGAHYLNGSGMAISHETCARFNLENGEGGAAALHMVPYVQDALQGGLAEEAIVVVISNLVRDMLIDPQGYQIRNHDRIQRMVNFYDSHTFVRVPNSTREDFLNELEREDKLDFERPFIEGKWMTFVGRRAEFKGIEQLIHSWAMYLEKNEDSKNDVLFVIGPELTDESTFADLAKELGIVQNIRFIGKRSPEFINKLQNVSNLAAMTSLKEGDGVVVKQPGGSGIRIVATNSGGPQEYFDKAMGTLADSRDPSLQSSRSRGLELLLNERIIQWGNKRLEGADIIRDFVHWEKVYSNGDVTDEMTGKWRLLGQIADSWDSEETKKIREDAIEVIKGKKVEDKRVCALAKVFMVQGGRDVENESLADAYKKEFLMSGDEILKERASRYVRDHFSLEVYFGRLDGIVDAAAERRFDEMLLPVSSPSVEWFRTLRNERVEKMTDDFKVLGRSSDDAELLRAFWRFHRGMVTMLGNPSTYPNIWYTPNDLAIKDRFRTVRIIANTLDIEPEGVVETMKRIAGMTASNQDLQISFFNLLTRQLI